MSCPELPVALRRLAANRVWLGFTAGSIPFLLAFSGYFSFKPKYLETQFQKTASEASLFTG